MSNFPILQLVPLALRQWRVLVVSILLGLLYYAAIIVVSGASAVIIGGVIAGTRPAELAFNISLMAASVGVAAFLIWAWMVYVHDFAYAILASLRVQMFAGLTRLAPRLVLGGRTGDIGSALMNDVELIERFFSHAIADYVIAAVIVVGGAIVLAQIHPLLGVILIAATGLISTIPFWLARTAERQGMRIRRELGSLTADLVDSIQGMKDLVAFGQFDRFIQRLDRRTVSIGEFQRDYGRRVGLEAGVTDMIQSAAMLAIIGCSAWLVAKGEVAVELYPLAVVLVGACLMPVLAVTQVAREFGDVAASAARTIPIAKAAASVLESTPQRVIEVSEWSIEFDAVRFSYDASRGDALQDVSFRVAQGETVAITGRSGAGKSTCINLLLRLWIADGGTISVGGTDVREWSDEQIREVVATVPQDVYLFNVSILDNIRLGAPSATVEEVEIAAKSAQAHDFISSLPDGYHSLCGERALKLSGGQRQRIAIARAILRNAPILVLDEAASNLDVENEVAIRTAMKAASRGRTTLIVAHRPETVQSADRVIVLDRGRCVQVGSHESLLETAGPYAEIFSSDDGPVGQKDAGLPTVTSKFTELASEAGGLGKRTDDIGR